MFALRFFAIAAFSAFLIGCGSPSMIRKTSAPAADASEFYADFLKKKLGADSVKIHIDKRVGGFIAKASFPGDSTLVLAGGIGESVDIQLSIDEANLHTSSTAAAFIEGKFGKNEIISPITLTTALAQKGEWIIENDDGYICIKVLDADKILYKVD
jgi:hypothetical protein